MTEAERQMRRGLSSLLLEAPVSVVRDLSALVQAREDELSSEIVRLRAELDEKIERLNNFAGFVARWCYRDGKLTDAERVSAIKYHPVTKAAFGVDEQGAPHANET